MERGTVVQLRATVYGLRSLAVKDVPRLIALLGLTDQQIAERLNSELGITLVSAGIVRLWAEGRARPPFEWIETLARIRPGGRSAGAAPQAS